ncbi:MAG TPA: GNAT family N-acetyltransferase [Polyangiales bacterium]|nr:GNAT family N-acetyltransferase [Polyangiales bacterium]
MIQIRLATVHDASLILRFIHALAAYERQPEAVKVDEDVLRAQLSEAQPPFECLIAEVDGAPSGFALFFTSYSTWLGKRGIWLEDLFVLPEVRRLGLGTALLRRLGELAAERDCGRLEWSVLDWNQPAIDFYASLGARVMGEWRICRVEGAALQNFVPPTTKA